jgi:hypothetical protein
MTKPTITTQVQDGALGVLGSGSSITAKFGVATSVPALLSGVTKTGTSPTCTVSGVPVDIYNFKIKISLGGTDGVGTFDWSKDGGQSWVETGKTIPAGGGAYALGATGASFVFVVGTYVLNDTYVFTAQPIPVARYSDPSKVKSVFTSGPLVEDACITLDEEGGEVLLAPVYPSIAGTSSVPVISGTSPAMTITGAATDNGLRRLRIVTGGTRGVATFQYSLDDGLTWSSPIATAATYAIPGTGTTANFASGSYVAGDSWTWADFAPKFTNSDLANTFDAFKRAKVVVKQIHICTDASGADDTAKATAMAATAASVQSQLDTLAIAHLDTRAIIDAPDVSDAALIASVASLVAPRVDIAAGPIACESALTHRIEKRTCGFVVAAKFHGADLSVDISCPDPNEKGGGPLYSRVAALYRDEDKTPGLDDARFITLRTWNGKVGFFFTNPNSMADATSDYSLAQNGFVIDKVSRTAYQAMIPYASRRLRTNRGSGPSDPTTGTIEETQAVAIEKDIAAKIRRAMGKDIVGDPIVKIDRTINLIATRSMAADVRVQPYGYPKAITIRVGFEP